MPGIIYPRREYGPVTSVVHSPIFHFQFSIFNYIPAGDTDRSIFQQTKIRPPLRFPKGKRAAEQKSNGAEKMKQQQYKAVLFDFDGTLGDTLPLCVEAFHRAMEPILGRTLTDGEILATFGPSEEGTTAILLEQNGIAATTSAGEKSPEYQRGLADYFRWYEELHPTLSPRPFAGIPELLRQLKAAGIVLGLVTGKGPVTCELSLKQYDMAGVFDAVETGYEQGLRKPDGIGRILDRFKIAPSETIYVGDMPSDVAAARSCGVETLAAAWASTACRDDLAAAEPLAVIDSVADLRSFLMG